MTFLITLGFLIVTFLGDIPMRTIVAAQTGRTTLSLPEKPEVPSLEVVSKYIIPGSINQRILSRRDTDFAEIPLFRIGVEQIGQTRCMNEIRLKATLVPLAGVTAARVAVEKKKVYFIVDGIYIGSAFSQGTAHTANLSISAEESSEYRFKPGRHKLMALAAHDGNIIMGNGTLNVEQSRVKIKEITDSPSEVYYILNRNLYYAGHTMRNTISVAAQFTDAFSGLPVAGARVYYRNGVRVLDEKLTNNNGVAAFSFRLTYETMRSANLSTAPDPDHPLVTRGFNFMFDESDFYYEVTDVNETRRLILACKEGFRWINGTRPTSTSSGSIRCSPSN